MLWSVASKWPLETSHSTHCRNTAVEYTCLCRQPGICGASKYFLYSHHLLEIPQLPSFNHFPSLDGVAIKTSTLPGTTK